LLGPGRRLVVYDPASPEVLEWAKRARQGAVTEWDLTHVPLLRAWASRVRRGAMPFMEWVHDPIIKACDSRRDDESVPAEERYLMDPVARLLFDSPKAWRKSARESETQEPSGEPESDSPAES
jgi:hypothetical protein